MAALAAIALLATVLPAARAATPATSAACEWPMYGHDPGRTFSTTCAQAPSPANVSTLVPKWFFHANDVVTATPTVVGGVVYVGAWNGQFYALDQKTGALHWSTTIGPGRTDGHADHHTGAYGTVTSTAAVATVGGRRTVFVGGGDSVYALDASRDSVPDAQRVLWSLNLDPTHPTSDGEIESSPVVWTGAPGGPVLIVGSDANQDSGYLGEGIWEIRAATGHVVFHWNPETATGHALYGCGNVWSSPALSLDPTNPDPHRRAVLIFGTADCPDNSTTACPTDRSDPHCPPGQTYDYKDRWQRFSEAIIAISATDGTPLWSFQGHVPLNADDDDYGASAQLFTLPGGRPVVGEGNKNGVYSVLDRTTGKLVWQAQEQGNGNVQPGFALGGFLGATAVGPGPRVFGSSAIDTPFTYDPATGNPTLQPTSTTAKGIQAFKAFSGVDGKLAWSGTQPYSYGATSTANGVVYTGALDGIMRAYDAATGALLWAFPVDGPISSGAAVTAGGIVLGTGTSESDVEFKTCDHVPTADRAACKATPLNATVNPLSKANGVWAFGIA
jgi:polyvinyl alcohol dehydrogenase (cytochrome)